MAWYGCLGSMYVVDFTLLAGPVYLCDTSIKEGGSLCYSHDPDDSNSIDLRIARPANTQDTLIHRPIAYMRSDCHYLNPTPSDLHQSRLRAQQWQFRVRQPISRGFRLLAFKSGKSFRNIGPLLPAIH